MRLRHLHHRLRLWLAVAVAAAAAGADMAGTAGAQEAKAESQADTISRDKAVELARGYTNLPKEYQVKQAEMLYPAFMFYANGRMMPDPYHHGAGQWKITLATGDEQAPYWEVAIDAASSVLQRISRMPPAGAPQPEPIWPAVTYDEARKLAEMFVSSANPAILSELKISSGEFAYDPMLTSQPADGVIYSYHFKMNRLVNGIPFPQDGVSVELDGDGRIVQYNLVWDPKYRFQDPKYAMAMKDALPAFRDRIHLTTVIPQVSADHSPLLIYDERPGTVMAAATGQFMDLYGRTDPVISSSPLAAKPLSAEPQRQAGGLTKDKAIARTRALFHIADSAEVRSDAASLPDGDKWVFDFQMGQGGRLTAEVDQATGLFDVVNRYEPAAVDAPPAMTRAEAQSRAEQFLLQLVPYESNELTDVN